MVLRSGRVTAVDAARHAVSVELFDSAPGPGPDDIHEVRDLPVLVTRPGDYSVPAVGALVVVLLEPGPHEIGYVLGCIYSESDQAPENDADARLIAGPDVRIGQDAEDAVALAPAVDDALAQLKNAFQGWTPVANDGGAALKAALTALFATWPPSVAAENVVAS